MSASNYRFLPPWVIVQDDDTTLASTPETRASTSIDLLPLETGSSGDDMSSVRTNHFDYRPSQDESYDYDGRQHQTDVRDQRLI